MGSEWLPNEESNRFILEYLRHSLQCVINCFPVHCNHAFSMTANTCRPSLIINVKLSMLRMRQRRKQNGLKLQILVVLCVVVLIFWGEGAVFLLFMAGTVKTGRKVG